MTELGVIAAVMFALCAGYYLGRRVGSHPATWKTRTSRLVLGRLVLNLLLVMSARRIQRNALVARLTTRPIKCRRPRIVRSVQPGGKIGTPLGWVRDFPL
jgi:hypothetical protein